jgi:ribose 5-phosphate isomerase B
MQIALGSDHAGYLLKKELTEFLRGLGHQVLDVGTHSADPVDYPDYAEAACRALLEKQAERAVVICGSGVGASVTVNKLPGIRGAVCHDCYSAHQGVEHDDMNVLVLGARVIGGEVAKEVAAAFLGARFSGAERHVRRLNKVKAIEARYLRPADGA